MFYNIFDTKPVLETLCHFFHWQFWEIGIFLNVCTWNFLRMSIYVFRNGLLFLKFDRFKFNRFNTRSVWIQCFYSITFYLGTKYLVFVSSRSVKLKEFSFLSLYTFWGKCVYFSIFEWYNGQLCQTKHNCDFWMIKCTIMSNNT